MKLTYDNKGVSLALTIGLLLLLVSMTATVNLLVLRSLRASYQIEASDKAYFAAEAGIEDALYELSAHSAGYGTNGRKDSFSNNLNWNNEWSINSYNLNNCSNIDPWADSYTPSYCGRLYGGQKLILNLFSDEANSNASDNGINTINEAISELDVNGITIKFRLANSVVSNNGLNGLYIDNDGDLGTSSKSGPEGHLGLNEDADGEGGSCGGFNLNDADCDGRESEDSINDYVFLWRLVDDEGNSFQPKRGCLTTNPDPGSNLCEKDFSMNSGELSVSLDQNVSGFENNSNNTTLFNFLDNYGINGRKLQMEFAVVAPMEAIEISEGNQIPIPYYEYGIEYNANGKVIPSSYFAIESDGYFNEFKQSITTNVTPRATTRLLDLTIIQQ